MWQDYWEERAKRYGHTGWSSPIIYAFDNPIRIKVVDYLLNTILQPSQRDALLDFGCGTGEFSITVLQHIIDPKEMESVLSLLYEKLKGNGFLLVLESFAKVDSVNSYEKSWNYPEFIQMMENAGFKLNNAYNYYETDVYSEEKFQRFSERKDIILLSRIYNHVSALIKKDILSIMQWISFKDKNLDDVKNYLYPVSDEGISRFIIFRKCC